MKASVFSRSSLALLFLLLATLASAQTRPAPAALPGYWNVETNLTTRDYTIVRFYDGHGQLVYEERLPNLCLDLSKSTGLCRRTARQLNVALQQALRDPRAAQRSAMMLARHFQPNRRIQRVYAVR